MKPIKKIILFLLSLVLFTCSKDEKEKQYENLNLEVNSKSVLPLEFVILSSDDYIFTQETYPAKFGDLQISLMLNEAGELIFPVPNVVEGNYELELIIGESRGLINFYVNPHSISDSQSIIEEELLTPLNEFNQASLSFISEGNLSNEVLNQLFLANSMYSEFMAKLSTLSDDEKLEIAMFFEANPIITASLNAGKALGKKGVNSNVTDCFKKNADLLVSTTLFVLAACPIITAALAPPATLLGVMALVVTSVGAIAIIAAAQERLMNDCFIPFENLFKDSDGNVNDFEFSDGIMKKFNVWYKLRRLISSDTNNDNQIVRDVAEKWNVLTSIYDSFKRKLNKIISTTSNWFTSWFSNGESSEEVTFDILELPATSEEYEEEGDYYTNITTTGVPEGIAYEVIDNDGSSSTVNYKFTAIDKGILPITFQVRTNYFDGDIEYDSEFRVHLKAAVDSTAIYERAILGHWIRTNIDTGHIYDVFFEENGGGKYSQEAEAWGPNPRRWYDVNWRIYKKEERYYIDTGIFLWGVWPTDPLTYPPTYFNEYGTELEGGGLKHTFSKVE